MQFFNPSRNFHGLFHLSGGFLLWFIISNFFIWSFCSTRHLRFSVPGDCDFLVYVLYCTSIFIKKMRYGSLVLSFILVINSNASQLTYSFIGPPAVVRRVLELRSVHPGLKLSYNWLFSFFWNWTWCQGLMWCCAWQGQIF